MLLNSRIADLPSFQPEIDRPKFVPGDTDAASRYDQDLQQRVHSFLNGQHRPALRDLNVEAREGVVTLRGNVPTFYEREITVRLARRVAGVVQLVDEIIVGQLHIDPRRVITWAD
jgi:osmotically-inducible protein OsmY